MRGVDGVWENRLVKASACGQEDWGQPCVHRKFTTEVPGPQPLSTAVPPVVHNRRAGPNGPLDAAGVILAPPGQGPENEEWNCREWSRPARTEREG